MPKAPKKIKASWVPERKAFGRRKDNSKFYNSRKWRKTSRAYRDANPVCEVCLEEGKSGSADVCDHTRGLQFLLDNNLNPYDYKELKSMCHHHHNIKSGKDAHNRG